MQCVKKYEEITKPERFLGFFHIHKIYPLALLGLLQNEMTDFLPLSYISTSEIQAPSYT